MSQRRLGFSTDLQNEIAKANPKRLDRWSEELERNDHAVLRTSFLKTLVAAVAAWIFVASLVTMFTIMPLSKWNPLSQDFGGWAQFIMGVVLFTGLILFGFGAVVWTFVFPAVRPRMIVSQWGVRTVGSKPGGQFTLFAAAWSDNVEVDGFYTSTRWPFPSMLHVKIIARGDSVERNVLIQPRKKPATVVHPVSPMLQGRTRDVLAFLVEVQAAVGEGRDTGCQRIGPVE